SPPFVASQTFSVLSEEALTMYSPSGLTATSSTDARCPDNVKLEVLVCKSHTFNTLSGRPIVSPPALTTDSPSGFTAIALMRDGWQVKLKISAPVSMSHPFTVLSVELLKT